VRHRETRWERDAKGRKIQTDLLSKMQSKLSISWDELAGSIGSAAAAARCWDVSSLAERRGHQEFDYNSGIFPLITRPIQSNCSGRSKGDPSGSQR
jgi:hypothetical protein